MNIVFMGTPDFAANSLKNLILEFNVLSVFTKPDKPKGRGKKLAMSPVKEVALLNNIEVFQPNSLKKEREYIEKLKNLAPDFIIVVAYGQILPKELLDIPKKACINLHASILPRHRGAAPINYAVMCGDKVSGNTTIVMDAGIDTGDMLLKSKVDITEDMTAKELHDILMIDGGKLLVDTIKDFDSITKVKQDDSKSTYASMLSKDMAKIHWNKPAKEIKNLVRGLNSWPIAYTHYEDKVMKVYSCDIVDKSGKPGEILEVSKNGIVVATKEKAISINTLQFPGKKQMKVQDFILGNDIKVGEILK